MSEEEYDIYLKRIDGMDERLGHDHSQWVENQPDGFEF